MLVDMEHEMQVIKKNINATEYRKRAMKIETTIQGVPGLGISVLAH